MAIISYGRIDKKLLSVAVIVIADLIKTIISYKFPNKTNFFINDFIGDISSVLIGIIFYIIFNKKEKNKQENKKSFKYIVYLFLFLAIKLSYERLYIYFNENYEYNYDIILNTINGAEIILMTFGTSFLLKYKYYIHHIISMSIYCLLGIACDFIYGYFFKLNYTYITIYIIYIFIEVMMFCYFKYMMDKLYYNYYELIMYWGIIELIVKLLIYSMLAIYEYKNDLDENPLAILNNIYNYFTTTNIYVIIFYQFLCYIVIHAIINLSTVLMIYYLRPNHKVIVDEFHTYENLIIFQDDQNKYYTLIPFVFQIIALIFYFECLELNFCKLNYNTIKNIQAREGNQNESENEEDLKSNNANVIELNNQYYMLCDDSENNYKKSDDLNSNKSN